MPLLTPSQLAQHLRMHRKEMGKTQAQISDETGIRQDTISRFEVKPDNARLETLYRLLNALDLELHIKPKGTKDHDKQGWSEPW